ncbi:hypothetical protein BKA65DRAFT_517892 [Rhexocercosporidium sp. MPI-PUGE-AT-0058]|nr:hypothetical protein BKA65DRAFT_517892 [Rhexocercosporidium sp. MPI-PUGE-AT-0058]
MRALTLISKVLPSLIIVLTAALLVFFCSFTLAASVDSTLSDPHVFPRQGNYANDSSPATNKTESLIKIRENIHCYALPYGGLGFGSHVLTYYCMFVNAYGRRPLVPWKRQEYQKLDVAIGFLQLVGTTIAGTLTVTRCKGEGHLQLLGIWMLLTSAASSIAAMLGHGRWLFVRRSREVSVRDGNAMPPSNVPYNPNGYDPPAPGSYPGAINSDYGYNMHPEQYNGQAKPYPLTAYYSTPQYEPVNMRGGLIKRGFWSRDRTDFRQEGNKYGQWTSWGMIISLWLVGCAMGFVGSVGIAREVWDTIGKVKEITKWFFMPAAVMFGLTVLLCMCTGRKNSYGVHEHSEDEQRVLWFMMKWTLKVCLLLLVFMLVYMDWLLAAVTGNWSGVPSKLDKGGKVLYWVYFVCKRFALFMY